MNLFEQLPVEAAFRAAALHTEMGALIDAQATVTDGATPEQVYGRIGGLIEERRAALAAIFQQHQGQALAQLNERA